MNPLLSQLLVVASLIVVVAAGPVIGLAFLSRRKRIARSRRRSPIGISLLRAPGHTLNEQLTAATEDVMAYAMTLMVCPLAGIAAILGQSYVSGQRDPARQIPIFLVLDVVFTAAIVRRLWKLGAKVDILRAGYDAEVAVGQELDQLMRRGAAVFHDFPCEGFNIDHVVVSQAGVFAVETKGYTKPVKGQGKAAVRVEYDGRTLRFPTWSTTEPIEQAERQAAWLAKWIQKASAVEVRVVPVLALPGWFIERKGRGDVRVFSGGELPGLLESRRTQALSAGDAQRVLFQIEQRCRTVAPKLAPVDNSGR